MESPIPPLVTSPDFRGDMSWRPHQAAVDGLINRYTKGPDSLQNQRNLELLTKVGDALETMEPKLRAQLNSAYRSGPRSAYILSEDDDHMQSRRHQARKMHGLTLLGDGRFNQLVRHGQFNNDDPKFELRTDEFTRPLTEDDRQELQRLSADPDSGLSQDTRQALRSIGENMDKLDYAATGSVYMSAEQFPLFRPTQEDMLFFPAEQTTKHYGFGALLAQKRKLVEAVEGGDLAQIRQCFEAYQAAERITDEMLQTLHSDKLSDEPIYSDNVESTRLGSGELSVRHLMDFVGQNKLNSLIGGYTSLKNVGMRLEELANDPCSAIQKLVGKFLEGGGLDGRPDSIGAALQAGLKSDDPMDPVENCLNSWFRLTLCLERALSGIAGMEKDPDRRARFLAVTQLSMMEATQRVKEESRLYQVEQKLVKGKRPASASARGAVYQTAALAPEQGANRFNLRKLMTELGKKRALQPGEPDPEAGQPPQPARAYEFDEEHKHAWRDLDASVKEMIRQNETADLMELAGRNEKVLREAEQERQFSGCFKNKFDPDLYLLHAFSAQSRVLRQ